MTYNEMIAVIQKHEKEYKDIVESSTSEEMKKNAEAFEALNKIIKQIEICDGCPMFIVNKDGVFCGDNSNMLKCIKREGFLRC